MTNNYHTPEVLILEDPLWDSLFMLKKVFLRLQGTRVTVPIVRTV